MKQKYEDQRDKEFAAHVCVKHARAKRPKTEKDAAVIKILLGTSYEHARRRLDQNT